MRNCIKCKKKFLLEQDYKSDDTLVSTLLTLEKMKNEQLPVSCFKCYKNLKEVAIACNWCKLKTPISVKIWDKYLGETRKMKEVNFKHTTSCPRYERVLELD